MSPINMDHLWIIQPPPPRGIQGPNMAQLQELFLKQGCESGRQWGFVTFASPEEAANAQAPVQRWGRALQKHHHTWGKYGKILGKYGRDMKRLDFCWGLSSE